MGVWRTVPSPRHPSVENQPLAASRARRVSTLARWTRYSTLALRSACGSASAAACSASVGDGRPAGQGAGDAAGEDRGRAHVDEGHAGVAVAPPCRHADDRPVLRPPVELLEAPPGAVHLRHADLGEQLVGGQTARQRSLRRSRRPRSPEDRRDTVRRTSPRAPTSVAGRSLGRVGMGDRARRSCPGGGPAGRRRDSPRERAAGHARRAAPTSRCRGAASSAPMAMWSPASRIYERSVIRPMSMSTDGWARRNFISGSRLCPPARNLASSPCWPARLTASSALDART